MTPLCYWFENGEHVIFNKYTIENGIIKNEKGEPIAYKIMHNSQHDAAKYLRHIGYDRASNSNINIALSDKSNRDISYDRTWKNV
jgi:hypothetical protein